MNQFMVDVERIVRPVRAGARRKLRVRQELLAHLGAAFQEERGRHADAAAARAAALARLGPPAELTRELQATVPAWERWLYAPVPGGGNAGAVRRLGAAAARRPVLLATLWAALMVLSHLPLAWLRVAATGPDAAEVRVAALCLALVGGTTFAFALLGQAMGRALGEPPARPRWLAVLAFGSLAALALFAAQPPGWRALLGAGAVTPERLLRSGVLVVLVTAALALVVRLTAARRHVAQEWLSLTID